MNVESIVNQKKCMICGACSYICPVNAIHMEYIKSEGFYRPQIDSSVCIHCRKCLQVCPADEVKHTSLMGEYQSIFLCHSTNPNVRHSSTSGGVINSTVRYLLTSRTVDAVLMTGCADCETEAEPLLITLENMDILTADPRQFASRYVSVPVLNALSLTDRIKSLAVVGTSCQIQALRKNLSTLSGEKAGS